MARADIKIKASMEWKCPHCALTAKGTLNMNGAAMAWLDSTWEDHLKTCRDRLSATVGFPVTEAKPAPAGG